MNTVFYLCPNNKTVSDLFQCFFHAARMMYYKVGGTTYTYMLQPYLEVLCGESTAAIDYKNSQSIVSKSVYIVRKKEKRKKDDFHENESSTLLCKY